MLYSQWGNTPSKTRTQTAPILVFLHGFLGSSQDWQACLSYLSDYHSIQLDLPCHGSSKYCDGENFQETCQQIHKTLLSQLQQADFPTDTPLIFIGYSLGARLVMYGLVEACFDGLNIQGAILESGNFGLKEQTEKNHRWEKDKYWSKRFAIEAIDHVLLDWYQQDVFSSLTPEQRQEMIALRMDNLGSQLANMLRATSLAKQPYLLESLQQLDIPILYVCGTQDHKFQTLAQESGLTVQSIAKAGHNVHHEQPAQFARLISEFIQKIEYK